MQKDTCFPPIKSVVFIVAGSSDVLECKTNRDYHVKNNAHRSLSRQMWKHTKSEFTYTEVQI